MNIIAVFIIIALALSGCADTGNEYITEAVNETAVKELKVEEENKYNVYINEYNYNLSKYEPDKGCYLGAYILTDTIVNSDINNFEEVAGKEHSMYIYNMKLGEPFPISWVLECYTNGKMPHIIMYPPDGYTPYNKSLIDKCADEFGRLNIPIFLQLYPNPQQYGTDATSYISFYREVKNVFNKKSPNTAFIWSVDSNEEIYDSEIYYPGDAYTDWVGINIYKTMFDKEYEYSKDIWKNIDYFYYRFQHRKPIMISQLGVSHYSTKNHTYETVKAANSIMEIYNRVQNEYPMIKGIVYMDYSNIDRSPKSAVRDDYSISGEKELIKAYRNAVGHNYFIGSHIENDTESGGQYFKSPFIGYKINGDIYISAKTITYDLDMSVFGDMVIINGEEYRKISIENNLRFSIQDENRKIILYKNK